MDQKTELMSATNATILVNSGVERLLSTVRPHWQAKNLITRVKRLLPADPSSACQRIFNATIHDLKEKLAIAGIDIVSDAAKLNKLPPISKVEDIERYSAYNTIDLAYRVGLVSHPESKRLFRVYDIRGDLEHEDDEYEATIQDCVYTFTTCIECVLSRDPIEVIRLTDVKNIVEQPTAVSLSDTVIDDFKHAPNIRQLEIHKFLVSNALNLNKPDIVRQNCYTVLAVLSPYTRNQVVIDSSQVFISKIGRDAPDLLHARVAYASGIFPYLKKSHVRGFFAGLLSQMKQVGYTYRSNSQHGELMRNFNEVNGFQFCPEELKPELFEWLILCYIGETGGYGMGANRKVFFSNTGAPLVFSLIKRQAELLAVAFNQVKDSREIKCAVHDQHVARRLETIRDVFSV